MKNKISYSIIATLMLGTLFSPQHIVQASTSKSGWKRAAIVLDGNTVQVVPFRVAIDSSSHRDTVFFPVWYLMQLLRAQGINSAWDAETHSLSLTTPAGWTADLKQPVSSSSQLDAVIDGTIVQGMPEAVWNDPSTNRPTTFLPLWYFMKVLQRLGFESNWDGSRFALTSPAYADPVKTFIQVDPNVAQGSSTTVHVTPVDFSGDQLGSGENVTISDGTTQLTATWNAKQHDYEATFTEHQPGQVTFTATINGVGLHQTASTNVQQVASASNSVVLLPASVFIGTNNVLVSIIPKDSNGTPLGAGHTVTVSDGTHAVQATWNDAKSMYEAVFSEMLPGTVHFEVQVDLSPLSLSHALTTDVYVYRAPLVVSPTNSSVSAPASVTAGTNNVLVSVAPKYTTGTPVGSGHTVTVSDGTQTVTAAWNAATSAYEATLTETRSGTVQFTAKVDGVVLSTTPSTVVNPNAFSLAHSTVTAPTYAEIGAPITTQVEPQDAYGNVLPNQTVTVTNSVNSASSTASWNTSQNAYESTFTDWNPGSVSFHAAVNSQSLTSQASTTVEIPSIIASVPHEVNGSATVTNAVYEVTLESVDSQGNPMPLSGDVLLDLQDVSSALGNSTQVVSGFAASSAGPYTGTVVSLASGQTSANIYAQFNFTGGSGTVHSTDLSLQATSASPVPTTATYSSSQNMLTINFDESMNPTTLTTQNISSNLHSFGSGVFRATQVVWSNNNETVEISGLSPTSFPPGLYFRNVDNQFTRPIMLGTWIDINFVK
jgi:hypothetical protein